MGHMHVVNRMQAKEYEKLADLAAEQAQARGIAATYVKCLQILLRAQVETLVLPPPDSTRTTGQNMEARQSGGGESAQGGVAAPPPSQPQAGERERVTKQGLGLPRDLEHLVRRIWLSYIPMCGILEITIDQL